MSFNLPLDAEAGVVEGRITNTANSPLVEASVVAMPIVVGREMWDRFAELNVVASALTDADGRYSIHGVRPGVLNVTASHEGYIPNKSEPVTMMPEKRVAGIDLQLEPGGVVVSGLKSDAGGGVIAGGKVWMVDIEHGEAESVTLLQGTADAEGKYRVSAQKGAYVLRALADGYESTEQFQEVRADTTKDFKLNPAARITGIVIEKGTGKPVAEAKVAFAANGAFGWPRQTTTDGECKFTSPGLSPAEYRAFATKGAWVGQSKASVAVHQTDMQALTIEVEMGLSVAGHVRTKEGNPIGCAKLTLCQSGIMTGPRETKSDRTGAYKLDGISPDKIFLEAAAEGLARAEKSIAVTASVSDVDLVLDRNR